jgi:hypothetical protein
MIQYQNTNEIITKCSSQEFIPWRKEVVVISGPQKFIKSLPIWCRPLMCAVVIWSQLLNIEAIYVTYTRVWIAPPSLGIGPPTRIVHAQPVSL